MELLNILANIAQILSFIWILVFGALTLRQVIQPSVSYFKKRPFHPNYKILALCIVAGVVVFMVIALFFPPIALVPRLLNLKTTPTVGITATPLTPNIPVSPGATSLPCCDSTVTPSATPDSWHTVLNQPAPSCNNSNGVAWQQPQAPATTSKCAASELAIQNTDYSTFAEIDLTSVNGKAPNLTTFRAQVTVRFEDTQDAFTTGGLIIRVPTTAAKVVGYIVQLYSDAGRCELLQIKQGQGQNGEVLLKTGYIGQAGQNLASISVIIVVKNAVLYAYSPDKSIPLFVWSLPSNPSALGLVTYGHGPIPSTNIFFSNFQFDQPN